MKYILLIALLHSTSSNSLAVFSAGRNTCIGPSGYVVCYPENQKNYPYYEHTPTMFGGIFDTEKDCMSRAKGETDAKGESRGYCLTVNGYDRSAKLDEYTPFKEVK